MTGADADSREAAQPAAREDGEPGTMSEVVFVAALVKLLRWYRRLNERVSDPEAQVDPLDDHERSPPDPELEARARAAAQRAVARVRGTGDRASDPPSDPRPPSS